MDVRNCFLVYISFDIICLTLTLTPEFLNDNIRNEHIKRMDKRRSAVSTHTVTKRSLDTLLRNTRQSADQMCSTQENNFLEELQKSDVRGQFAHKYTFPDEKKYSIALVWVGENSQKIIVSVSEQLNYFVRTPSTIYISTDEGRTFVNITSKLASTVYLKEDFGLQKDPEVSDEIYFVADAENLGETDLYVTLDGGSTYQKTTMPFDFKTNFVFHPTERGYMLAHDSSNLDLYVSTNHGTTWEKIKEKVINYRWSTHETEHDVKNCIYVATDINVFIILGMIHSSGENMLEKTTDGGRTWFSIHPNIVTFGSQGHFLYASIKTPQNTTERYMEVSTNGGKTWAEAQLPTITEDRFYSILDMSEGQIFMHVDDPGDTGVGTLYSSDASGVIFSLSLEDHLYPNYEDLTDFYRVLSMRGVYISSQLNEDLSIRTMITFDRGGEWKPIQRPTGVPCQDESKECYLHIHHKYSKTRGVKAKPPKSVESAIGIILVHGQVANSLQTTDPDVFVSSDGGYTWRLALNGPHHYEIADQGGLLVAVPAGSDTPNTVKFSTDEGRCWHTYKFTDEQVIFTGLLTEPGNKAMSVAIWGYGETDRIWRVNTIDFEKVIGNKCMDGDYESWTPHSDNTKDGCLLGKKETFQRLKPDAWCLNGHAREIHSSKSTSKCQCTPADYDCDYGFKRNEQEECEKNPIFKSSDIKICSRGHEEELLYLGYHRIPGDECEGGFKPPTDKVVNLKAACKEGDKSLLELEEGLPNSLHDHVAVGVVVMVSFMIFIILGFLGVYAFRKYSSSKRSNMIYRYSSINTEDSDVDALERALAAHTSLYEDSSDDEQPPKQPNGMPRSDRPSTAQTSGLPKPVLPSYHDDSDEDMLM